MKACSSLGLVGLLGALVAPSAEAQTFAPVLDARWERVFVTADVSGQDGRAASDRAFHTQPVLNDVGPFDVSDTIALNVVAPDGTGAARVDHVMSQHSFIGTESVSEYVLTADLNEALFLSSQAPAELRGSYSAGFSLVPAAAVPEPRAAWLLAFGLPLLVGTVRRLRRSD